jgi:hypothetical protein
VITLDMVEAAAQQGHASLTAYLSRPLSPAQMAKLSPADRKARRLAQVRASRWRLKVAKALARHAATTRHPTRDIIDLSPAVIAA